MTERSQFIRRVLTNMARYILVPLIAIGLIIFIIWALFIRSPETEKETKKAASTSQTLAQKRAADLKKQADDAKKQADADKKASDAQAKAQSQTQATQPPAREQVPATAATPTTSSSAATTANGQPLSNSGPGDIFALFTAVVGVSAALRYYVVLRRLG